VAQVIESLPSIEKALGSPSKGEKKKKRLEVSGRALA
jgi:hypothetical protein